MALVSARNTRALPAAAGVATATAARTGASVSKDQCWQPDAASRAYKSRFVDGMKMRPPTTDGGALIDEVRGKPKAQRGVRLATRLMASLASASDWNRVFCRFGLQPFQAGPDVDQVVDGAHRATADSVAVVRLLAVTNSATARRASAVSANPCSRIGPLVSASTTASGDMRRRSSSDGTRSLAVALWQVAQTSRNTASPEVRAGLFCAMSDPARTADPSQPTIAARGASM